MATVANTAANRRWTFGVRGRRHLGRHHLQALTVFGLTWGMSSLALLLVGAVSTDPGAAAQTVAIAAANLVATAVRFVAMRRWIFSDHKGTDASSAVRVPGLSLGVTGPSAAATERQSA